ncbi:hypothetical protein [Mucilaginibacter agri]|uniref:Uncharacterized protein n=1 Tax=Mucilaginibacter agri TaxID=2695265 RepID=A0A965ZL83_9SPHI|nr:hypothetical protein [Mucilaginibacter agri]NCD71702.1 hypothetical protein [Mucilaginibacter agri]
MTNNFKIQLDDAEFEFYTMQIRKLLNFQVYVMAEGVKHRFHMQLSGDTFVITDPTRCPQQYRHLESTMSDAILKLGQNDNLPL